MATIRNPKDTDERIHREAHEIRHVGQRVQLRSTGEVGIVIRTWYNEDIQEQDCYVAFDDTFSNEPTRPYILRYAAVSLMPIESDDEVKTIWWDRKLTTVDEYFTKSDD